MGTSVIVWNVRGLCDPEKRGRIKRLIGRKKPAVVGLTETKWRQCTNDLVTSVSGNRDTGWIAKDSDGSSGGIVVFWDKSRFQVCSSFVGRFFVGIELKQNSGLGSWFLAVVYGPQERAEKLAFLEDLNNFCQQVCVPICIAGDFNLVRSHDDYMGSRRGDELMNEFNTLINSLALLELPLGGSNSTWSRGGIDPVMSRIDRAFVSTDFDTLFPDCTLSALERVESDHNPLWIKWGDDRRIRRPWRFENMWLMDDRFFASLETWLQEPVVGVGSVFLLARRLQQLKQRIKVWNKEVFGNVNVKVDDLLERIKAFDLLEENGQLNDSEGAEREVLRGELQFALNLQEIMWRQKSNELWLKGGDLNTKFFHRVANYRRKFNFIESIKVNGRLMEGREELASGVVSFYQNLFKETLAFRPFPKNYCPQQLSASTVSDLVKPFSEAEVWAALVSFDGGKSPGPDGFTFEFLKKCWFQMRMNLMQAFEEFHRTGSLPKCVTHSFICLVPKKDSVEDVKDLRPISLMGSINKLLSKVLMERMGSILPSLVSDYQHASVRGRQISEAGLIANEIIDSRRKSNKPGLMFKLDLEKAFDNVSWDCLFKILSNLGFPQKWQNWIRGAMCSPVLSILVNGESHGFFSSSKGLRQGDPLSPGLFVLVMDVLSFMLGKLREKGKFRGFFIDEEQNRGEVTHLLFADDTLIFCEAEPDQVLSLLGTLVCFQAVTGLKVNLDKSMMYTVGEVPEPSFFADIFGCKWSRDTSKYLGFPLGARPNSIAVWDPVINSVQHRLEGWKGKMLSFGGRLTLNSSCLNSQVVYYCSLFLAPKTVMDRIEKLQKRFIWSGTGEKQKFHLVGWDLCKATKKNGGIGALDFESFNHAMLCKWMWKFAEDRGRWWRDLIEIKYSNGVSLWHTGKRREGRNSSVWVNILRMFDTFWKHVCIDPGGGAWVSFWHDSWIPKTILADSYPRIAAAALSPDAWISDIVHRSGESLTWDINLNVSLRGGAERERVCLIEFLNSHAVERLGFGPARIEWLPNPDTVLSVRSLYRCLTAARFPGVSQFPAKAVWKSVVPLKICGFLWICFHQKILTIDNLKRRGWALANRCELCQKEEESVSHIFVDCDFTKQVWNGVISCCPLERVPSNDITSTIRNWPSDIPDCIEGWISFCSLHAICWTVWRERNRRIFDLSRTAHGVLSKRVVRTIVEWVIAKGKVDKGSGSAWLSSVLLS
ncbi:unnamed protein product [Linum trigynum]|uniref:Reverse transcriptase domain-containing protein n=1 Tax=Linum trigynum TaxID=586398 RepID=A0AAV2EIK8_9ROSI